uniref:Uncharacterized protein n=1 Tax=Kalanchoe fedtschenkoi TaxID=63787 RepID=A0A7N0UA97_KALFE
MSTGLVPVSVAGVSAIGQPKVWSTKPSAFVTAPKGMTDLKKPRGRYGINRNFAVYAEYKSGGTGDFAAGFLLGGAVFGTLAYIFAPQIRRSLLNEDEYGFRKAKRPIYYDGGLEKTRETLNAKINQLNAAIDNVSSRLRGGGKEFPPAPVEADPEVEATL